MKKATKLMSLLLAMLMLASTLAACSDTAEPADTTDAAAAETTAAPETTEAETTIAPELLDELPTDVKFNNYEFVILSHLYPEGSVAWKVEDIFTEAENGERINDAVYKRNLLISERFGATVKQALIDNAPQEILKKTVQAGDDSYALIQCSSTRQSQLVTGGFLSRMDNVKYINFDKAWWDSTGIDTFRIAGKVHFASGSGQLNNYKATWAVFFNKKLVSDANLPDMYEIVRQNKWTLDNLKTYGKAIAKDVNGDGQMEWGKDVFGVGLQRDVVQPLVLGTGARILTVKNDGTYTLSMGDANFMNAMEKTWKFINEDNNYIINASKHSSMTNLWVEFRKLFAEDQMGFYMAALSAITQVGPIMQSDFGILPMPHVNPEQEGFYSDVQYTANHSVAIPKNAKNLDRTGLLTEAYQMYSHDTVRVAYYDHTLTYRTARDNESGEMLDLIFAHRNTDPALGYDNATKIGTTLLNAMSASSFTFASDFASTKEATVKKIDTMLEAVLKEDK